jgi:transcriptional regulator with PAS, ATPase and Fis domain
MGKTLVSWVAVRNDFLKGAEINERGPTLNFHEKYFTAQKFQRHILLVSETNEYDGQKGALLYSALRKAYPKRAIEMRAISMQNPSDLEEVLKKVEGLITSLPTKELEILVSNGTPAMFASWVFLASKFPRSIKLLQLMNPAFSKDTTYGDLKTMKLEDQAASLFLGISATPKVDKSAFKSYQPEALLRAKEIGASQVETVLIRGENGTGKSHLAKAIHENSHRREEAFTHVNCAAFSDELLLSELFGHKKGAFTGATEDKTGVFEAANNGTVFLDEIGDISPFNQVSLLRVIENRVFNPVGAAGSKELKLNIRIITATNQNLEELCAKGAFRWDLYYRLAVAELHTKPVRNMLPQVKQDMVQHFSEEVYKHYKTYRPKPLVWSKEALEHVMLYDFPGNIRQVQNLIESLYTHPKLETVKPSDLPERLTQATHENHENINWVVAQHYRKMLAKYGSIAAVGRATGSTRNTIKKYLEQHI